QQMHHLNVVLLLRPRRDQPIDLIVVPEPPEHVSEPPVLPLRMPDCMTERLPFAVVADRDRDRVVLATTAIDALRRVPLASVADALRHAPVQRILHNRVPGARYCR